MGMLGLSKMLEVLEGVSHHSLVQRTQVGRRVPEGIACEVAMEVVVDVLPIEAVVVRDEDGSPGMGPSVSTSTMM